MPMTRARARPPYARRCRRLEQRCCRRSVDSAASGTEWTTTTILTGRYGSGFARGDPRAPRAEEPQCGSRRRHADRPLPRRRPARQPPALQERGAGADRGDAGRRAGRRAQLRAPALARRGDVPRASRAPRSTRRSGPAGRATSTGATELRGLGKRDAGRAPAPVRRARRARRGERPAGPGRRRHLPRRARRDRARDRSRGVSRRREDMSSLLYSISTCAGRRSSSGPRRSSAGRRRTCSTGFGAGTRSTRPSSR